MYTMGSVIAVIISMAMFSGMILTPLYVQNVRGISPLDAGLMMLPGALMMGFMSPITGKLFDRVGPRPLAIVGLAIVTVSTYYLSKLTLDTSYTYLIVAYTVRMFGMSMVMMPIMTNGLNQLPMRLNPHGTAINNTLQQVAGAIGSAVMITIMTNRTKSAAEDLDIKARVADKVKEKAMEAAQNGEQMTEVQLAKYGKELAETMANKAMVEGINFSFFIAMIVTIVALVLSFFLKRVRVTPMKMGK